jgi:hypothetical protein
MKANPVVPYDTTSAAPSSWSQESFVQRFGTARLPVEPVETAGLMEDILFNRTRSEKQESFFLTVNIEDFRVMALNSVI